MKYLVTEWVIISLENIRFTRKVIVRNGDGDHVPAIEIKYIDELISCSFSNDKLRDEVFDKMGVILSGE